MNLVWSAPALSLRWFLRMRWLAVCGQAASFLGAGWGLGLDLPWSVLAGCLVVTLVSNHWYQSGRVVGEREAEKRLERLILLDGVLLTILLASAGGWYNPFAGFYLLLMAVAAMTLSARALVKVGLGIGLGWLVLAWVGRPFAGPEGVVESGHLVYSIYHRAVMGSIALIAGCLGFFLYWMRCELREREQDLMEADRRAEGLLRYQSLATLAAGVAHELGSPLGTIAVASQDLMRGMERDFPGEEMLEDARLIRSEVERCRQILRRLDRESTRRSGEALQEVTVEELFGRLRGLVGGACYERMRFVDESGGRKLVVSVDALLQAMVVLMENACEADGKGGAVEVRVRVVGEEEWVFEVRDGGCGVSEGVRRRLGEPFFTTKKKEGRMGLGLFLVNTLMGNLGGSCRLHAQAGGGTCAELRLPVEPGPPASSFFDKR